MRKPFLVVLSILFAFYACTKIETTDIGSGLIPPIDGVNVKDTFFDVITNTFIDDNTARVYKGDDHVIGVISNDPLFGKTTASAFFELKPTVYPFSFDGIKDSLKVDSAVLILSYKGVYGDSTMPQTWRVFEIDQQNKLQFDSAYGTTSDLKYYSTQLGEKSNFDIRNLDDSLNDRFENASNQIRIKLNSAFAARLLKTYDTTNAYKNDSMFRENFAGFAVVPDQSSGNALLRVNLLDTNTKLSLYYSTRKNLADPRDTVVTSFRFNTSGGSQTSGAANIIKRERTGSQLANFVNTGANDSVTFVQTSPGTFVTVKVPNLSRFRNVLVHRAELVAVQAPYDNLDDVLSPPRYILLTAYDSVNKRKRNVPNDFEISNQGSNISSFGGFLTSLNIPGYGQAKAYNFTLTRYVQGIVTRHDSSYALRMYAPANDSIMYTPPYPFNSTAAKAAVISPSNANNIANGRVRLFGGGSQSAVRMRLHIIYSEL